MDLIGFLIVLLVICCIAGVAFWIIGQMELAPPIRGVALAVVGIVLLLMLFGIGTGYVHIPVPRFR